MTDRIHPRDSPPSEDETTKQLEKNSVPVKLTHPIPEKPLNPPRTYVVQIPKDQIYRQPPPGNARRYQDYTRRENHRNRCCCCLCWILSLLIFLILLIAIAAGVLYLIFRPKAPIYSVEKLSIKGFNLTSLEDRTLSPEFEVNIRAQNPNKKIGIYYKKGSSVSISHSDVRLCNDVLPAFYQPSNNVTDFQTDLTGLEIRLTTAVNEVLTEQQKKGEIPLVLDLKVPVRVKVGSLKTWTITVKVRCDVIVDKLTVEASMVSKKCDVAVKLWGTY